MAAETTGTAKGTGDGGPVDSPHAWRELHRRRRCRTHRWQPVRRRLAQRVAAVAAPYAWTIAELVIPKSGGHSVGVRRRTDPATGQAANCQRALGLFLAGGGHAFPVDWNLMLSGPWDWDQQRRRRARIPKEEKERSVRAHVLDYAADVIAFPLVAELPWVLDLTGCEDAAGVLVGLARKRLDVVDPGYNPYCKLCDTALAPWLFLGAPPRSATGRVTIVRDGTTAWEGHFDCGGDALYFRIRDMAEHLFSFPAVRRPGLVNYVLLGADEASFHDGFRIADGDRVGIDVKSHGVSFENTVRYLSLAPAAVLPA